MKTLAVALLSALSFVPAALTAVAHAPKAAPLLAYHSSWRTNVAPEEPVPPFQPTVLVQASEVKIFGSLRRLSHRAVSSKVLICGAPRALIQGGPGTVRSCEWR